MSEPSCGSETFKVGDIISAYHKGFWEITKIDKRKGHRLILHYTQRYNSAGQIIAGKQEKKCYATFCLHAIPSITAEIQQLEAKITQLKIVQAAIGAI